MSTKGTDFFQENDVILLFFEMLSNRFDPLLPVTRDEAQSPVRAATGRSVRLHHLVTSSLPHGASVAVSKRTSAGLPSNSAFRLTSSSG